MKQQTKRIDVIGQYRYNMLQVMYLVQMSEDELERYMMETAMEWVMEVTRCDDEEFIADILNEDEMRRFWLNEWCKRDNCQFLSALYNMPDNARQARYMALHRQELFTHGHPVQKQLRQQFARVIDVLINPEKI